MKAGSSKGRIEAAGGVVLRRVGERREVVIVHRPRYDDWTLPKGKLDPGESFAEAASREVEEETGLTCRLEDELTAAEYSHDGRPKLVRYWRMAVVSGRARDRAPDGEVDEVRWVEVEAAGALLTHDTDRRLLREAIAT